MHPSATSHPSRLACNALWLLAITCPLLRAVEPAASIDIGVRSTVDERWKGVHKGGAIEHGRVYAIIAIKESPSAENS